MREDQTVLCGYGINRWRSWRKSKFRQKTMSLVQKTATSVKGSDVLEVVAESGTQGELRLLRLRHGKRWLLFERRTL